MKKLSQPVINIIKSKIRNLIADKLFIEVLTGSIWAFSAQVIAAGMGIATTIIVARVYGSEILGITAILYSFIAFATTLTVLGTNTSVLRLIPEHLTKYSLASAFIIYKKARMLVSVTSIITAIILFLSSDFIANQIFSKPDLSFYFAIAAIFIFFQSIVILNTNALLAARLRKIYALMLVLPSLSRFIILLLITILYFHQDNPIFALFAAIGVTAITGTFIMESFFKKNINKNSIIQSSNIKEILTISMPMVITATMTFIIAQSGIIMLGIFRSESEVGYFAVALKLASLTSFVLGAVGSMASPKFSELYYSNKIEELLQVARKSAKLIFWATTPILLGLAIFGKLILGTIFGYEFIVVYPALIILVIGQFVNSISGSNSLFMNMTGNQNILRNIIFVVAIINIVLNLLLIPKYGIIGAAITAMITITAWNVVTLYYIKKKFGKTTGYFPMLL